MLTLNSLQFKTVSRAIIGLCIVNIFAFGYLWPSYSKKQNQVYFLSVGEGDAELIQYRGKNILIDAGPDRQILKALGEVLQPGELVDLAIITHSNTDHYEGLRYVLEAYSVTSAIMPEVTNPSPTYKNLLEALLQQKTKLYLAKAGSNIKLSPENFLKVLWPLTNEIGSSTDLNSQALVILYTNMDKNFLFTSDISEKEEGKILAIYPTLKADILKIAHHGSKGSSSYNWLKALNPTYGIIEVGENTYGHPTLETLNRLNDFDILTLRTDWQGNIGFIFKPSGVFDLVY